MPETDIFNPTAGWDPALGDSMNPSYGFTRKRGGTQLKKKAVGGVPWTRETQNTGHSFPMGWMGRTLACVERIKWYYEQYEDGFFTLIDWDAGGRHYVGRFTTEPNIVETANNKYSIENLLFEEIPRVPMVQYPADWDNDAVLFNVGNDFGDQKVASSGSWTQSTLGTAPVIKLGGFNRTYLSKTLMTNAGATAGDWAAYTYRGYGCKLWMQSGPAQGKADVYVDGVLNTTIDCYAAAASIAVALTLTNLSLDIHDIKVIVDAAQNALSTGAAIGWYGLQVMR
jgi:hypothetical protein